MNNKILIAASVGLSLFAAAQSKTDQQKPKPTTTQTQRPKPSDHVSARSTDQKAEVGGVIHRDLAARDVATSQASGNKSAHDDWSQAIAVPTSSPASVKPVSSSDTKTQPRVAKGDVNGDGAPDVAASKNSAHATEAITATSPSKVQTPRDVATGQASGKRQHQPLTTNETIKK